MCILNKFKILNKVTLLLKFVVYQRESMWYLNCEIKSFFYFAYISSQHTFIRISPPEHYVASSKDLSMCVIA